MKWAIPTVGGERMYQDFLDILSTAKNGLLDTLGGSLWNSTRTGHILPMRDSFATSIVSEHCPTILKRQTVKIITK